MYVTGVVGLVEVEPRSSSAAASQPTRTKPAAVIEDILPGQAFSEDGACSVWPIKGGPDLQMHLADIPKSCWTIPWQDAAASGECSTLMALVPHSMWLCSAHQHMRACYIAGPKLEPDVVSALPGQWSQTYCLWHSFLCHLFHAVLMLCPHGLQGSVRNTAAIHSMLLCSAQQPMASTLPKC